MKAIFNVLFIIFLLAAADAAKLKKTKCVAEGLDCDYSNPCCAGYCVNDRCQAEKAADTLKYYPLGDRCNRVHECKKGSKCIEHRCIPFS